MADQPASLPEVDPPFIPGLKKRSIPLAGG